MLSRPQGQCIASWTAFPLRFIAVSAYESLAHNQPKVLSAPVTVIIDYDLQFQEQLPKLLPPQRLPIVQGLLKNNPDAVEPMAMRNGSLQGAYLLLAARALGVDCWPMSGFDNTGVDREFFAGTRTRSNFICSLGFAHPTLAHPRAARLTFEEANRLV